RPACYANVSPSILRVFFLVNRAAQGRTSNTEGELLRWTARGKSMSRNVVVLGAGMVGVSVAWPPIRRTHRIALVHRCKSGGETSFGNAGVIQREAVRPYGFPRDIGTLLRVLPNRQVDIRYRPTGMLNAAV